MFVIFGLSSKFEDSILAKSITVFTIEVIDLIWLFAFWWIASILSFDNFSSFKKSISPFIKVKGVRISWEILVKNCDLNLFNSSNCCDFSCKNNSLFKFSSLK